MYLICVFVCLLFLKIHAFNFDTNNPTVYVDPEKVKNSTFLTYFGYTVVLYDGHKQLHNKWIKIGAPRGRDPNIPQFDHSGVVYNCPYMNKCNVVDVQRGNEERMEILRNAWIGGTMDISSKFNKLAICAFRKVNDVVTDHRTTGCCYLSDLNNTLYDKLDPLKDRGNALYYGKVYYYGQGEAGFSAHFPKNEENALLLGAPGVLNWAGTVLKVKETEYQDPVASRFQGLRNTRSIQRDVSVANPVNSPLYFSYDLFGYSLNSGYFYGSEKLYYAASAPKSSTYKGKVIIFEFNGNQPVKSKEVKVGSQFGEYFGASIAAGDINNDGCDDLIVGAPYHVVDTFNEGRVYTFFGNRNGRLTSANTLYGEKMNGQFGSAIMFLGDIDRDGYGDVAIGAPYEEDFSGVLYIFKGNKQGLEKPPCQRIIGKDISSEIRGFGISISRPADMDANGYNDVAVGAHLSGNAVLLKGTPIVVIGYDMVSIPKELRSETQKIILQCCYWYTHLNENAVDIQRTLVIDEHISRPTISQNRRSQTKITLKRRQRICENVTIALKKSTANVTPIRISLSYKLDTPPKKKEVIYISDKYFKGSDIFCIKCPVLDEFRSTRANFIDVPFSLGCGPDNICQSDLSIEASIPEIPNKIFVVGSLDYVNLLTTVKNRGENAYATQLEVMLPDVIHFRQIPPSCNERNISVIICNMDNPLGRNKEKTINLNLDMKNVKNFVKRGLSIRLKVLTTSKNSNSDVSFDLQLKMEADLIIYGNSGEQSLPFGNTTHGMPNFTQMYQVEKIGASPLERVLVHISIPYAIRSKNDQINFTKLYQPEGAFAGQPIVCKSNFDYILVSKPTEISEGLVSEDTSSRRRRQTEVFQNASLREKDEIKIEDQEYEIVPNKTFFLNCSTENVLCSSVICTIAFEKQHVSAKIQIKMMFDTSAILDQLKMKDMVLFSTNGSVVIESPADFVQNGNRPDSVEVSSLFVREIAKKKVPLWIIILSVLVGLLILILIIYGLTKAGFFKREKKEELKNLKAAVEKEGNELSDANDDVFETVMNSSNEGLVDEKDSVEECEE